MFEAELNFGKGLKLYRARSLNNLLKKVTRAGGGNAYSAHWAGANPPIIQLMIKADHPSGQGCMELWETYIHVPFICEYERSWSARGERRERFER